MNSTFIKIIFALFLGSLSSCNNSEPQPRHETAIEKNINANGYKKNLKKILTHFGIKTELDCNMVGDTRKGYCLCEIDSISLDLIKRNFDIYKCSDEEKEQYYKSFSPYGEILSSLKPYSDIKNTTIYENMNKTTDDLESLIFVLCIYQKSANLYNLCIFGWTHE